MYRAVSLNHDITPSEEVVVYEVKSSSNTQSLRITRDICLCPLTSLKRLPTQQVSPSNPNKQFILS